MIPFILTLLVLGNALALAVVFSYISRLGIVREQLNMLVQLVDHIPIGIVIFDDRDRLIFGNKTLTNLLKKSGLASVKKMVQYDKLHNAPDGLLDCQIDNIPYMAGRFHFVNEKTDLRFVFLLPKTSRNKTEPLSGVALDQQALYTMAMGLAHELKNPMTAMKMVLEMDPPSETSDPKALQNHHILSFEMERLDKIVGDFLDFADSGQLELSAENINDILSTVEHIVAMTYPDSPYKIKKIFHPLPKISVDRVKMVQVFLNLVMNSIEAFPDYGGEIEMTTRHHDSSVIVEIKDNGKGIRQEDQGKVFLPFFTTKPNSVGLGLAYTQKIILSHHGTISYTSKPGVLTVFTVILSA